MTTTNLSIGLLLSLLLQPAPQTFWQWLLGAFLHLLGLRWLLGLVTRVDLRQLRVGDVVSGCTHAQPIFWVVADSAVLLCDLEVRMQPQRPLQAHPNLRNGDAVLVAPGVLRVGYDHACTTLIVPSGLTAYRKGAVGRTPYRASSLWATVCCMSWVFCVLLSRRAFMTISWNGRLHNLLGASMNPSASKVKGRLTIGW